MAIQQDKNGFSLVEFMIAMSILAIGLLAVAGMQSTAIRGNLLSKGTTSAILLGEKKMEEFKNTPYTSLTNGTFQDPNNPLTDIGGSGGRFNRSWTISTYSGSTNMRQITITITWSEGGLAKSTSLDTVISR